MSGETMEKWLADANQRITELEAENTGLKLAADILKEDLAETQRQFESVTELADSMRTENERLKKLVSEIDGQLGQQACRRGRCIQFAELEAENNNLKEENERLRETNEAIKRVTSEWRINAERYRWLRDEATPDELSIVESFLWEQAEELDATIDAAMDGE